MRRQSSSCPSSAARASVDRRKTAAASPPREAGSSGGSWYQTNIGLRDRAGDEVHEHGVVRLGGLDRGRLVAGGLQAVLPGRPAAGGPAGLLGADEDPGEVDAHALGRLVDLVRAPP